MGKLNCKDAYKLFMEHSKNNYGTWINRSMNVAEVSKRLGKALELDEDLTYIMGLMYDIGRIKGNTGVRHTIDGYKFLKEQGYDEVARFCITHAFITKDVTNTIGEYDVTNQEYDFLKRYLDSIEYGIYDRLIQLSDSMAMADGFVILETRLMDVCLRYGMDKNALDNVKGILNIQIEIEEKMGHSIYDLFPEIKDNIGNKLAKDIFKL